MADFDPDAYLAQEQAPFDPDAYLGQGAERTESTGDALQTFAEGAADMSTLGYRPQVQAGIESAVASLPGGPDAVNRQLREQGFDVQDPGEGYVAARDRIISGSKKRAEENPEAAMLGSLAGLVGPSAGVSIAKAAGRGAKALGAGRGLGAILGGTATGAAYNPGDVEGELSGLQLKERLGGAAIGGGIPAVNVAARAGAQKLARGVGKKISNAVGTIGQRRQLIEAMDDDVAGSILQPRIQAAAEKLRAAGLDKAEENFLQKLQKNPLGVLRRAKRGTQEQEMLAKFSKTIGDNLRGLSEDVTVAGKLGTDWRRFFTILGAGDEARARIERGAYKAADKLRNLDLMPKGAGGGDALARAILEARRESGTE